MSRAHLCVCVPAPVRVCAYVRVLTVSRICVENHYNWYGYYCTYKLRTRNGSNTSAGALAGAASLPVVKSAAAA